MKSSYKVQQNQLLVNDVKVIFSTNLPNVMLTMASGMVWLVEFGGGVNVDANIAWPSVFFCFVTGN